MLRSTSVWQKLAWLAAGGAMGTLARYGLTGLAQQVIGGAFGGISRNGVTGGTSFPWGTLVVNVLGCFLFGWIWSLTEHGLKVDGHIRLALFTGFLGAFTTFSTYAFETGQILRHSQWLFVAVNMLVQNGLGMAAVLLGFVLGRS